MKVKTAAETANVLREAVCVNLGSPETTVKVRRFSNRASPKKICQNLAETSFIFASNFLSVLWCKFDIQTFCILTFCSLIAIRIETIPLNNKEISSGKFEFLKTQIIAVR